MFQAIQSLEMKPQGLIVFLGVTQTMVLAVHTEWFACPLKMLEKQKRNI